MTAATDSSRNRRASLEKAPPVTKTNRSLSAGMRARTAACSSIPDISGICRSHKMTSNPASRSSSRSAS